MSTYHTESATVGEPERNVCERVPAVYPNRDAMLFSATRDQTRLVLPCSLWTGARVLTAYSNILHVVAYASGEHGKLLEVEA